jgi:hypothetical protein
VVEYSSEIRKRTGIAAIVSATLPAMWKS